MQRWDQKSTMKEEASRYIPTDKIDDPSISASQDPMDPGTASLEARIEALLFISSGPVSVGQLSDALHVPSRTIRQSINALRNSLEKRGIRLQEFDSQYQLTTAPEFAADVERMLILEETSTLSRAALEVLAIIAYQQPVTRPQIDSIRGVNSDSVLRTLLRHGLIEEAGRSMSPGRPILYSLTPEFLQHFGITALEELPPLDPEMMPKLTNPDTFPEESSPE
jgi:segregation and condensation protein B